MNKVVREIGDSQLKKRWHITPSKETYDKIEYHTVRLKYQDIFTSFKQRTDAFVDYYEFWEMNLVSEFPISFVRDAYKFLSTEVDPNFIIFSATKRKIDPVAYLKHLMNIENIKVRIGGVYDNRYQRVRYTVYNNSDNTNLYESVYYDECLGFCDENEYEIIEEPSEFP